jgi:hypothetical protein
MDQKVGNDSVKTGVKMVVRRNPVNRKFRNFNLNMPGF